jgi:hypothetical protein
MVSDSTQDYKKILDCMVAGTNSFRYFLFLVLKVLLASCCSYYVQSLATSFATVFNKPDL